ncbi:MAG TPA: ATP-binding protein [Capsulimonadaceae bacterium]|nr:ATP-binding protein [Capsulimonadaceae bacterium]
MILNLSLDLPEDGYYLRIARLLSRALLANLKVIEQDIDDIEIVVGELCANVLRHAGSQEGRFRIQFEYYDDRIQIVVEDTGSGFSAHKLAPVGSERADFDGGRRLGGFGLKIIESLSDHLEFHPNDPHGTTATAIKAIHYANDEDAAEAAAINASSREMTIRMRD